MAMPRIVSVLNKRLRGSIQRVPGYLKSGQNVGASVGRLTAMYVRSSFRFRLIDRRENPVDLASATGSGIALVNVTHYDGRNDEMNHARHTRSRHLARPLWGRPVSLCTFRVRNKAVAEDLVQETLLSAIQASDRYQGQSSEKTWLIGILKYKVIDHFRKLNREAHLFEPEAADEVTAEYFNEQGAWRANLGTWSAPEQSLKQQHFWSVLEQCIQGLPERLATLFALREIDGMETDEIRESLGISRNNLWVMLSRARMKMRDCLDLNWFGKKSDVDL